MNLLLSIASYRHFYILFMIIYISPQLYAREDKNLFFFTTLNIESGLSQQTVNVIYQDIDGYMWFATRNGLNRYDGYEFKVFRKNYQDVHSLCGNEIQCITQDSSRDLWIGSIEGLNRMDYETEELFRYPLPGNNNIETLFRTSWNTLFVFTQEDNWKYDYAADTLALFYFDQLPPKAHIRAAVEDQDGNLYLGAAQGLYIYDRNYRFLKHMPDALPQGYISFMTVDDSGKIWIVTAFDKVSCWDPAQQKLEIIPDLNNTRQLLDYNDSTMLGGTFYGLALLDKRTLKTTRIPMKIGEKGSLSHYSVLSLCKDREDNLWVGTYSGGVNYHNKYNYKFQYIPCQQFTGLIGQGMEDKEGNLWFATEGCGLMSYNPHTQQQQLYPIFNDNEDYFQNIIKSVLQEGKNILCATHNGEVFRFSTQQKRYELLYDYKKNDILALFRDSRQRLWIPTNTSAGMVVLDQDKTVDTLNVRKHFPHLSPIAVICEINEGQFLLGTQQEGLLFIDEKRQKFNILRGQKFGFSDKDYISVTAIIKDSSNHIWVSTNGAGLFCFDEKLQLLKNYNRENGLQNECIYNLIDQREDLWIITSREIFRLNKNSDKLNAFYSKAGLIPQEFTPYAAYCSKNGTFYLPASNGFLKFNPTHFRENQKSPAVLLTSLYINNEKKIPGKSNLLDKKLQLKRELTLPYNQTNITIGYTALNYLHSEQTNYAYRLEGVDENWNQVGNRREAFYSNLKPGEYKFQVIASNNQEIWDEESTNLKITVKPPLWFRWWAFFGYFLIVLFIIYKIVTARHRKHELEASLLREQLEQKKLEEINQERLRFFTQVTHEFRTPLTLIINPIEDFIQKYFHIVGVKESLLPVRKNAERLLSLVNSLMDIQKQQTGQETLNCKTFDFVVFLREIKCTFLPLAEQRNIRMVLECPDDILPVYYDREKLERLFFNLLSNGCKFTPPEGTITLSYELADQEKRNGKPGPILEEDAKWLLIHVKDTGIGIPAGQAEHIFDPFWHSDKDLHEEIAGSGMGLSITKLITEQHGGCIRVEKAEPTGTDMCVFLPYRAIPASEIDNKALIHEQEESAYNAKEIPEILVAEKKRYKILLVEDNQDILAYINRNLSPSYQTMTALNGREALEVLKNELPDMVVSDIMMPEMDGLELCRILKNDLRLCHIPVILLTARSMNMQMEEGFDAGADEYIIKPFRLSLLQSRIRNIFSNRERLREIFSKKLSLENMGIEVTSTDETFVKRYIEIVQNNFTNPKLDVDFICQEMGMSRANFYKKLHTVTDLSPMDMIRNIRLESAAQLLKESQLTISEITTRVGFNSNSYFSTCFKSLYGVTPKAYQANTQTYGPDNTSK